MYLPVMAAIAVWKKVVSVGRSPTGLFPQSLQHFLVADTQLYKEALYVRRSVGPLVREHE